MSPSENYVPTVDTVRRKMASPLPSLFASDEMAVVLVALEQAEQRAREWEIVAGHLEAKLIDVQERGRALEEVRQAAMGMLLSADAEWEEKDMGHDWGSACDAFRAALRRYAALTPPPAEEGAGNG